MRHALGTFVPHVDCVVQGAPSGPLHGLTFAAKDLFDVAGYATGSGNPDWERTHAPARRHAWAVQALLDAGCTLAGKTITDEISLGLLGRNQFYGTPLNPRAPDRVPGGSSSGSASAVAGGLVDLALGTDSGGSVRTPASFCGLYGLRPTHGRVPVDGMEVQSPSFDTCGWFAADAETFARAGEVLLQAPLPATRPAGVVVATDAFALADPETAAALEPMVARLSALIGEVREEAMAPPGLAAWARAQRTLQPYEAWLNFQEWIDRTNPRFQFSVARNLALAPTIPASERAWASLVRQEARGRMRQLLPPGTILCLPTTPFPAPLCGQPISVLEPLRDRITALCSHGGLTGVPQISLPGATVDGLPVGLSILGARGSDATLVAVARAMADG